MEDLRGEGGGKVDNHYDVITSMTSFVERSYYCHNCHVRYKIQQPRDPRVCEKDQGNYDPPAS